MPPQIHQVTPKGFQKISDALTFVDGLEPTSAPDAPQTPLGRIFIICFNTFWDPPGPALMICIT